MLLCGYPGCTAQYRRKEHLNRHARKHCAAPQLVCEHCDKTFERSDTLRRHQQLHRREEPDSTPRAVKACDRCHSSKTRCDGKLPCNACSRRGFRCTFDRQSKRAPKAAVAAKTTRDISMGESDGPVPHDSTPSVDIDGTVAVSVPDRSSAIQSILLQHEEELRQNGILVRPVLSGVNGPFQYSAGDTAHSPLDVDYHVEVYFAHFHPQWPFLHKPSFLRTKDSGPQVLLLTVVMIGLWVTGNISSRSRAEQMHDKLVALLENRMGDWKSQKAFKDKLWPMSTFQAILLNIIFAMIREVNMEMHGRCTSMLHALTTTCIAGGLFSYERMRGQIHASDSLLFSWTYVEETQRLALALFKVNSFFRTEMLSVSDLEFPLPENGYLWDAPETNEFYSRYHAQLESGAYAHEAPLICDIFREIKREGRGMGLLLQVDNWLGFLATRCLQQQLQLTGRHNGHHHHHQIPDMDIYSQLEALRMVLCQLDPKMPLQPSLQDIDTVIKHRNSHSLLTPSGSIPPRITITQAKNRQIRISLWRGDITTLTDVTAIVNAANSQMLGCFRPSHRCIDNVIHSSAGPRLRQACYKLMVEQGYEEPTGQAKITPGFNLHAQYVIHTVAAESLAVLEDGRKVIVFCCISTGIFAFPSDIAAKIALAAVYGWCVDHPETTITDIIFDTFLQRDWDLYNAKIALLPLLKTPDSTVAINQNPPDRPPLLLSPAIRMAQCWLKNAEYIIISAGAGLSAATGLDYTSPDLFAKYFPAYLPLGLRRLYDVFGFNRWDSPLQKWGYCFHHLNMVYTWPKSPLYASLRGLAERFGSRCFIRTSNADGLFVANRQEAVFPSAPFFDAAIPALDPETQCLTDSSKIPVCKYCGRELTLCEREYQRFIGHVSTTIKSEADQTDGLLKAVILELGVGMNTPSVLRWANDELVEDSPSRAFRLIRVGLDAAGCAPWDLEEQGLAVGISGDLNAIIPLLDC
ncbi:hypothetical protein BJX63DRAFT_423177 [Aspergillus granulosus]|uniref:Protein-ADP-ribose hydrolase n=1 Tax=Aspergillus granulosus TaxID=176169 RepID=A0ABR4H6C5_9EURO